MEDNVVDDLGSIFEIRLFGSQARLACDIEIFLVLIHRPILWGNSLVCIFKIAAVPRVKRKFTP